MNVDDMTAVLRPRLGWEAIDLGVAMVRRDYKQILLAWALATVPCLVLIIVTAQILGGGEHAIFPGIDPVMFSMLVFWWLKPLFDRMPLFIISRRLFGVRPGIRGLLRELPEWLTRGILSALLWRRFSLVRSCVMPVILLERLKGDAYRRRKQLLTRDSDAYGIRLLLACGVAEIGLALAFLSLCLLMIPEVYHPDWARMRDDLVSMEEPRIAPWLEWMCAGFYVLAVSLVEPFYVGAGFGLYVNSRTRAEGWDLELGFWRLASRLRRFGAQSGSGPTKVAVIALLAACCCLLSAPHSSANPGEAKVQIDEVLNQPEFDVATEQIVEYVRKPRASRDFTLRFELMDALFEVVFWLVVTGLVIALSYWVYRNRQVFLSVKPPAQDSGQATPAARTVMGLDVRSRSLPANVAAAAWEAWSRGQTKEALSLLYRGAISSLVERERIPIQESDTENDCLGRSRDLSDASQVAYFGRLTEHWIRMAYGKLPPDESTMKELCHSWPFRSAAANSK